MTMRRDFDSGLLAPGVIVGYVSPTGERVGVVKAVHLRARYVRLAPSGWHGHTLRRGCRVEYADIRAVYVRVAA